MDESKQKVEGRSSSEAPPTTSQRFSTRGGRGRGRGRPLRQRRTESRGRPSQQVSSNLEGPVNPIPPVKPKPQHLSKTQSPLTNDPLWMEAFVIDGDRGLVEDAGEQKFTVTADSLISLVKRTYETMSSADKEFNRHVSLSMYQYYNVIHFWARLAAIREHTGLATEDERNLKRYLASSFYPLHEPINAFLR